jgi:RimJ/RimL family protein N-acetyltransferase
MPMAILESQRISFRSITRDDLPMIYEWTQRPHVAEWWQSPACIADLEECYLPAIIDASGDRAYVAQFDDEPIGFIQSYVVMASGDGWWEDEADPGARGIDQYIAHPHQLNQGLGTLMIRSFVAKLFESPEVTVVQADPRPDNHRAIRSYTKAGFVTVGEVATPDGIALLMRCARAG